MTPRKLLFLLLALLLACGTIVMARNALAPADAKQEAKIEEPAGPEILVAARDIQPGTLLKDSDMKWQVWTGLAKDTMLKKGVADKGDYIGALSRAALTAGEPIIANRIFKASEQGFLSAALMPGLRAISVKVTPVSGLAGLIFPGDRVDVIIAHNIPTQDADRQSRERRVSETVVTGARVLALDQKTDEKATEPKVADVATLEVTPKDAEKIALIADWGGTLSLVLRSLGDDAASATVPAVTVGTGVAPQIVKDGTSPAAAEAAPPRPDAYTWDSDVSRVLRRPDVRSGPAYRVQVIRGKDSSEVSFQQ